MITVADVGMPKGTHPSTMRWPAGSVIVVGLAAFGVTPRRALRKTAAGSLSSIGGGGNDGSDGGDGDGDGGGAGGGDGDGGGGGTAQRDPQSAQSEPRLQSLYSAPTPPSSHIPS